MNRYKILNSDYPRAKKYLEGKSFKKDSPNWAVKFKDDLQFKNGKLYFRELPVIPDEDVDQFLRDEIYNKDSDLPLSRDGAFHLIKQRVAGISRARLMRFLKAQSVVESTRNARPAPRQKPGVPQKEFHFETDLVFVRKPDFLKISKHFGKTIKQFESYIVTTVEKITGVCRLSYVKVKDQKVVTPIVISHIKSICAQLGIDPKKYKGSSDSGGEFSKDKLGKMLKGWDFVKLGSSVEKKNATIQSRLFQLARAGRGYKLPNLLKQVERIENQNYSSVQKMTPNEAAKLAKDGEKGLVGKYNSKRKSYVSSDKTRFKVGDYVRIQLLYGKDKAGVGFKSYKNLTFSKRVYKVTKKTKNTVPIKYFVNRHWYTMDKLLLTQAVDEISEQLIRDRERQVGAIRKLKEKQHIKKRQEQKHKKRRPMTAEARRKMANTIDLT